MSPWFLVALPSGCCSVHSDLVSAFRRDRCGSRKATLQSPKPAALDRLRVLPSIGINFRRGPRRQVHDHFGELIRIARALWPFHVRQYAAQYDQPSN